MRLSGWMIITSEAKSMDFDFFLFKSSFGATLLKKIQRRLKVGNFPKLHFFQILAQYTMS